MKTGTDATFQELLIASQKPEVAGLMKEEMAFVKVDVGEQRDLAEKFGISSFPLLKFFCDGREIDKSWLSYHIRGGRGAKGLEAPSLIDVGRGVQGRLGLKLTSAGRLVLVGNTHRTAGLAGDDGEG